MKNFTKNDNGFICLVCGKNVTSLGYTSRDHCPYCLHSLHVDIMPGDRQNLCHGILVPITATTSSKKGYIINYRCKKCGELHNNKAAQDDKLSLIFALMNGSFNQIIKDIIDKSNQPK